MPERKVTTIKGRRTDYGFAYDANEVLKSAAGGSSLDGMPSIKPSIRGARSTTEESGHAVTPTQLTDASYRGTLGDDLGPSAFALPSQAPRRRRSGRVR